MAAKKKRAKTLKPKALGSGYAQKAGSAIKGRSTRLAKQECTAMGGSWKGGRCS